MGDGRYEGKPPPKRLPDEAVVGHSQDFRGHVIKSLSEPVSPPQKKRRIGAGGGGGGGSLDSESARDSTSANAGTRFKSPFQLTAIRDLPAEDNVDTVTVGDIFGNPLVAECWEFNYLHDIGFLMDALDEDVRHLVRMHVVHGFWKREDQRRLQLEAEAARYDNVQLHTAFMPEPFGTHHSKMAILFRHDDTAQVVIHTANMIPHDWANMTQGVWRSPLLPLLAAEDEQEKEKGREKGMGGNDVGPVGSGCRFKTDLLSYLRAYNERRPVCPPLVEKLTRYDFSAVQGALIASVPGRHAVPQPTGGEDGSRKYETQWGWAAMKNTLRSVPAVWEASPSAEIVLQVSSMATLGPTDAWLRRTLFDSLATDGVGVNSSSSNNSSNSSSSGTGKREGLQQWQRQQQQARQPRFRVVFPTASEIRRSLDGYMSGTSIHTKTQSAQQQKQLQYMRPLLCHWANDSPEGAVCEASTYSGLTEPELQAVVNPIESGRKRAAPHIKTYVRYGKGSNSISNSISNSVDWALLTSANLSKQAWGEALTAAGEMRVASWEIGVMVWPDLFAEKAVMQAVCGSDSVQQPAAGEPAGRAVVALRVPYNLPLQQYGRGETPWVCTLPHDEPDWAGRMWSL